MNVDILICSWKNDIPYLEYCLKSIAKFATGFKKVVLVVAREEAAMFQKYHNQADVQLYERVSEPKKWQIDSQAQKCRADMYCPEADCVFFLDSDCVFTEAVTPEDYFVEGNPVLLIEDFERIPNSPWKATTDRALGINSKYETMRRHGAVHWRKLFPDFRSSIEQIHGVAFRNYVLSCKADFPWGFSEFVALGNYALTSQWKDEYHFVDLGSQPAPKPKIFQAWSHSPPDKPQDLPSGGRATPLELYKKLGLL